MPDHNVRAFEADFAQKVSMRFLVCSVFRLEVNMASQTLLISPMAVLRPA